MLKETARERVAAKESPRGQVRGERGSLRRRRGKAWDENERSQRVLKKGASEKSARESERVSERASKRVHEKQTERQRALE
jgi:hypothetical protein